MNRKQAKKRRKKPDVSVKQAAAAERQRLLSQHLPTTNAKIIRELMVESKVKGHWKDFVVIAGKRLMDWRGSYDMTAEDGKSIGVDGMVIIHKSKLAKVVGEETALNFWRPGIGRIGLNDARSFEVRRDAAQDKEAHCVGQEDCP